VNDGQVRIRVVKILWDTYVLIEGVSSVVGEEPGRDSSHVGLGVVRHAAQTGQVGLVRLDGTNEAVEDGGVEMGIGETSTKGLEETSGFLGGQLDGPTGVPVEHAVNNIVKVLEVVWVGKESRNKVNLVVSGELLDELGLPTVDGGTRTEGASVSSEGRGEDMTVVLQLAGVVGVTSDVVTEGAGVLRGGARHRTISQTELAMIAQSE